MLPWNKPKERPAFEYTLDAIDAMIEKSKEFAKPIEPPPFRQPIEDIPCELPPYKAHRCPKCGHKF